MRCPNCSSSQTTYRVKTKDRICYKCGTVYACDENEEDKE